MKTFTHTDQTGHDMIHLVGSKDAYTVTEANGTITYESTTLGRKYVLTGNEQLNFNRADSQGKKNFKWDNEFAPFAVSPLVTSLDPWNDGSLYSKFMFEGNGDDALGRHNGTVTNATYEAGKFGQCMVTTEDTDIHLNTLIPGSTWKQNVRSIGFLVYRIDNDNVALAGNHALTQTQDTILFSIQNNKAHFYLIEDNLNTASVVFDGTSDIPVGQWSYIMFTWTGNANGDVAKVYVNGVLENSANINYNFSFSETESFKIGSIGSYTSKSAKFDTVDMFSKPLSDQEALDLANAYLA